VLSSNHIWIVIAQKVCQSRDAVAQEAVTGVSLRLLDASLYTFFAENVATIGHIDGCVFAAEPVVIPIADNVFVSVIFDRSAARSVTVGVTAVGGSRSRGIH
jgi:hypothetical protein